MSGRSCTVVLVGSDTAGREWITYEIVESWNRGMGVVGIRIHGLRDSLGRISSCGGNPFDHVAIDNGRKTLLSVVKCYTPAGTNSRQRYDWIKKHLANVLEEAIRIRRANKVESGAAPVAIPASRYKSDDHLTPSLTEVRW